MKVAEKVLERKTYFLDDVCGRTNQDSSELTSASMLRNPRFLLGLAAALIAIVAQSGELGSADTMHRLQTAHSFWTSEPPVFPNEYPEFGIYGRGGKLYD
jgi:hypothetical protein